ncbi:MAG: hypothetical protein H7061_03915 [Bdellovibrionaceae bacterium]|nr:hypothetical protein [Bdellovibrio sp.]
MESLNYSLKKMVIEQCRVRGVTVAQIQNSDPVIGGTGLLQLDSLDAVEIVTCLERHLDLKADSMPLKNMFRSFTELAQFVQTAAPIDKINAFIELYKN